MHTLDIVFSVFALIFVTIGIKRGFIGEVIRLAAMIGGFLGAFLYYNDFSVLIQFIKLPSYIRNAVSFTILYVTIVLSFLTLGWFIKKVVHLTLLGWLDRLLGAVLGFLKTVLLAWIVCLSISTFNQTEANFNKSVVFRAFKSLPATMRLTELTNTRNHLRKLIDPNYNEKVKNRVEKVKPTVLQ